MTDRGSGVNPPLRDGGDRHRPPAESPHDEEVSGGRKRSPMRTIAITSFALWTVAVLSAGVVGGWYLKDALQARLISEGPQVVGIPAAVEIPDAAIPDLRGLDLADAKQALVDGGMNIDELATRDVDWAGQPGVVLSQDPVVGEPIGGPVNLTVSAAATMPTVVGLKKGEAIEALRALGVEPQIVEEYDMSKATGSVLASDVPAGEPLPVTLTLTVAQAGSSVFLAQLEAVDSMCSASEEQVDAVAYPNSLSCSAGTAEDPNTAVWLINRRGRHLTGTVGVSDADDLDATTQVRITGDGNPLAQVSASYAVPATIDLDVSGVLRLEISVVSGETRSRAVLGDMILKGSTADIDTLETDS